ncbi:hypothetical protein GF339_11420, partial [candidate division KSB3 bacterium]|nr:hypothetical protein [candidate division KSB3 bacterium]MBD3325186.1 hypothetical protein [candidate division KSB3 bacterium]
MQFAGFNTASEVEWIDRGWYVVTEFERTPSINFQRAVELANAHPGFTPLMDERNIMIYRNIYRPSDLLQFQEMYRLIKNWKGAKLYVKGDRVEFDMIGSGIQCYIQTVLTGQDESRPLPEACDIFDAQELEECLGCLGCRRSHVSMAWHPSDAGEIPVWYAFGRLDQHRVYRLNKEELTGTAIGELLEYRYCPLLDLEQIRDLIRQLPEKIDPRKDQEWRYHRKPAQRAAASKPQYHWGAAKEPDILP